MRSMTGYGRGQAERDGRRVVVEVRSVNHRFLDLKLRGAALDPAVEEQLTSRIKGQVSRGALAVTVRIDGGATGGGLRVDVDGARRAHAALTALADALDLDAAIGLTLVSQMPGVLVTGESDGGAPDPAVGAATTRAADEALAALVAMREAEGAALARDLRARLDVLTALVDRVAVLAADAPADAQRRLRERIDRLLGQAAGPGGAPLRLDDARLAQEVAVLADRMDVTEELVRARSHLAQAAALMAQDGEVGRKLDFLIQELGREYNTIASKAQSAEIARAVVDAKAELERLREQVQNVE